MDNEISSVEYSEDKISAFLKAKDIAIRSGKECIISHEYQENGGIYRIFEIKNL